jgi:thiol:disulfide interchange protein DsbA
MKQVFSRTGGVILTAMLALSGCLSESSQAEAVNNQPQPVLTTVASTQPTPLPVAAPPAATFREGIDYTLISPPIPVQVPAGKTEVIEMFWYGCPHCRSLEPTINKYLQTKPDNVVFQRVPATLTKSWAYHARLYYVGALLDPRGEKNIHSKIFDTLQVQQRKISDDEAMTRFFVEQGFTPDQVKNAAQSIEMRAMLARSDDVGRQSKADSVPVIIINGKYMTSPSKVGSEEKLLQVINYLSKK